MRNGQKQVELIVNFSSIKLAIVLDLIREDLNLNCSIYPMEVDEIDAFAVGFHHRMDKRIDFAIVMDLVRQLRLSNPKEGILRVDTDGDKVYEQIVKRFP